MSAADGISPAWLPDGKEPYDLNQAGAMMAASISVAADTLEHQARRWRPYPTRVYGSGLDAQQGRQYVVASDGRFLNTVLDSAAAPITLLVNWQGTSAREK